VTYARMADYPRAAELLEQLVWREQSSNVPINCIVCFSIGTAQLHNSCRSSACKPACLSVAAAGTVPAVWLYHPCCCWLCC
jgi:hypothetical protein